MKKRIALLLVPAMILIFSCQKELSFETSGTPSVGTLQSDASGDCLPKNVVGTYVAGTALVPASNYIEVTVDVTTPGSYTIFTDTVNGFYFRATGVFTSTGMTSVILRGNGTPGISGISSFEVRYGVQTCIVQVTVLPSGSGGPAAGTLAGGPGACTPFTLNGTYASGTALNASHNVQVQLNVTTAGTYSITTDTVAGFWFSGSGTVLTGSQTITLNGNGTPSSGGVKTFTVKFGSSTCTFTVNVSAAAAGTLGGGPGACAPITVNGTYTQGVALTPANTVQVQVNVTTAGAYSITTNTVSGFSFSASGNFAATGTQNVTLNGSGTPSASGTINFTVTFGSSTCTFSVTVAAPVIDYFPRTANSNWSYEFDDDPTDSLLVYALANTITALGNTYTIFMQRDGVLPEPDSSGYYRKAGGNYHRYVNLQSYFGFDNPQWVDFIFLKDDQPAGHTWTTAAYTGTIGGSPFMLRIKFTITQKDVTVPVTTSTGTVNHPNTIVVDEKYEMFDGAAWIPLDTVIGYFKDYYSRNVGWILDEYIGPTGTLDAKMELRRFQVY